MKRQAVLVFVMVFVLICVLCLSVFFTCDAVVARATWGEGQDGAVSSTLLVEGSFSDRNFDLVVRPRVPTVRKWILHRGDEKAEPLLPGYRRSKTGDQLENQVPVTSNSNNKLTASKNIQIPDREKSTRNFQQQTDPGLMPSSPGIIRIRKRASKKLPQAVIIGVKKGGTRALLEFLRLHPDIRAPGPEPHFFDRHYSKGFEWYRNKMPPSIEGQITMEKSPSYFITKGVPRRVFNMSKKVKLIVVVRDPVTRAISDYTQTVSKKQGVRPFQQMVFLNNNTRIVDTSWGAIRIGVYAKHLEAWLRYFPLEQMHFVSGERLISNPAEEMAQLQDFLGLKRIITEKHFFFNESKGFPCLKKTEGSGHPHCLGKTKGRQHPTIDPRVIQRLRDFYRPFNAKFYQMVHQNFGWP